VLSPNPKIYILVVCESGINIGVLEYEIDSEKKIIEEFCKMKENFH